MKIVFYCIIASLLVSCSVFEMSKQERLQQFIPSETTYQEAADCTILFGNAIESEYNEPIIYGSIALYQNDILITGTETDFDGNYIFLDLDAGVYDLEISYVGYAPNWIKNIVIKKNFKTRVDVEMKGNKMITYGCFGGYVIPLIEQDNTTSGQTLTADQIRRRRSSN
jgi:hypothetical protein